MGKPGFDKNRRESKLERKTVTIRRVTKVTAGIKRLRFSAMVVVGDKKGSVGVALGRGSDTRNAVEKGAKRAEKAMKKIQLIGDTIPHEMNLKYGAARVIMRPARPGTGIIAGTSARIIFEAAGIENVYAKVLGTNDLVANTYCVFEALKQMRSGRIMKNMKNMQARVGLKEEMDKERQVKEMARRKKEAKEKGSERGGKGGDRRNSRRPERRTFVANKPNVETVENNETK